MPPEPIAVGPRVILRRPHADDESAWSDLVNESRAFLAGWISVPDAKEDPDARAWFHSTLAANEDPRFEKMLIVSRETDALLGALNFNEIVRGSFHSAYLGYWLGSAFARQGLMTEALGLALGYGFETLDLHRFEANLQPRNKASRALVNKLGFSFEGLSERYLRVDGTWRDHERWALTVERWPEAQR